MSVKFFGQFLIDQGEVDASHVRQALALMDAENVSVGQLAVERGFMQPCEVTEVHAEQRRLDRPFGDLAVSMGRLESEQLIAVLKHQRSHRLQIGQALVRLGFVAPDRLGILLDQYKADQAQYDVTEVALPDGLARHRISHHVLDLLPRFMMRVAGLPVKVGQVRRLDAAPEFAEVCVSIPIESTRGLEVAIVSDLAFAEALALAVSGLTMADLDPEMVADGVGEFLNVLAGNAASALAQQGCHVELGPPDYEAELSEGWIVDLAVGPGRAALVLSTF